MNQDIRHNKSEPLHPTQEDEFRHYSDALHRFFYYRTQNNEISDDLTQETIAKTYQTRPELFAPGREGEAQSYLYATARHVFANYVRDCQRHPIDELTEQQSCDINVHNTQSNIDNTLVWEHVKRLSPIEQTILTQQYKEELPVSRIANKLHKSTNAIKLISSRAKAKLRRFEQSAQ